MTHPGDTHEPQPKGPEVIPNPTGETIALRFDVLPLLEAAVGPDWREKITDVIEAGELKLRKPDGHYTNREEGSTAKLGLVTADGQEFADAVPGVWELYQTDFMAMMQQALPEDAEPLVAYDDPEKALEPYAQQPVETAGADDVQHRMEAHVDMRYTAVLVIDAPEDENDGGRLVIGSDPDAHSVAEIDKDATRIPHIPATLLCFTEGRKYPHYTEEVTNPDAKRVVISLNYPLEGEDPAAADEILQHIGGTQ
jgi:hypothetical protein